jgi:hypothetical protein
MADDDAARIEKLESEIARLRRLVADYAAEAARLRQNDQARARQDNISQAARVTAEEADFALMMGKKTPRPTGRKSA